MWINENRNHINQKKNFDANIYFRDEWYLKSHKKNINNYIYQLNENMNFFLNNSKDYFDE